MSWLRSPIMGKQPIVGTGGLSLRDLSLSHGSGIRGLGAGQWLASHHSSLPQAPNQIVSTPDGRLIMSLSHREFWILSPETPASLEAPASGALVADVWPLYCQHSHGWLELSGEQRAEVMAKLCGVDFCDEVFAPGQVAQTQVARVSAVVAHHLRGRERVFSILVDQSLVDYLWMALADAMAEFTDTEASG